MENNYKEILEDPVRRASYIRYRNRCNRVKIILALLYLVIMGCLLIPFFNSSN